MLSSINNPVNLFRTQLSILNLVRVSLEPTASIFTLLALVLIYESSFDGRHLILMLIVFFLTFPGKTPTSTSLYGLLREIVANWFVIFVILLFLGYATRSLSAFPPSLLLAWVLITPVVLFVSQAFFSFWLPSGCYWQIFSMSAFCPGRQKVQSQVPQRVLLQRLSASISRTRVALPRPFVCLRQADRAFWFGSIE